MARDPKEIPCDERMANLLKVIGEPGRCNGHTNNGTCSAPVVWCVTKNMKPIPIDPDGTPHYATCPDRQKFKKG
jgi:hypothetical protein